MTPTNRITGDVPYAPPAEPATPARPPVVKATRVYGWRCADCGCFQLAEMSKTHVGVCRKCGKRFTVEVR